MHHQFSVRRKLWNMKTLHYEQCSVLAPFHLIQMNTNW